MPTTPKFPCSTCHKNVNKNHRAVCCDSCDLWIHIKCNYLDLTDYNKLKNDPLPFFCINCIKDNLPFTNLTNNEFIPFTTKGIMIPDEETSNFFTPHTPQMQQHINTLNSYLNKTITSPDNDDDDDDEGQNGDELSSPLNCNYFDYEDFNRANFKSSKSFSIFHLNIHSIQKHIESLRTLLLMLESDSFEFNIIAISESKLKKNSSPLVDISIDNYHQPVSTPSEANKGGVLLYVNKKLNFKPRPDLKIYSPRQLESAFVEIINPKRANDIVGVVYRHPLLDAMITLMISILGPLLPNSLLRKIKMFALQEISTLISLMFPLMVPHPNSLTSSHQTISSLPFPFQPNSTPVGKTLSLITFTQTSSILTS